MCVTPDSVIVRQCNTGGVGSHVSQLLTIQSSRLLTRGRWLTIPKGRLSRGVMKPVQKLMPKLPNAPGSQFKAEDVIEAIQLAGREAVARHKALGQSIVVWRDGKVVVVPPEEIEI